MSPTIYRSIDRSIDSGRRLPRPEASSWTYCACATDIWSNKDTTRYYTHSLRMHLFSHSAKLNLRLPRQRYLEIHLTFLTRKMHYSMRFVLYLYIVESLLYSFFCTPFVKIWDTWKDKINRDFLFHKIKTTVFAWKLLFLDDCDHGIYFLDSEISQMTWIIIILDLTKII